MGLESFMALEDNQQKILLLKIRARANTHRNAKYFCMEFTDKEIVTIKNIIKEKEGDSFIKAGEMITGKIDSLDGANHTEMNSHLRRSYKIIDRKKTKG